MNITEMIFHHALTQPQKPAVILPDRVATYGMMAQGMLSVTDRLRDLHLAPGALVAVVIESPIRHLILALALYRMGHPVLSAFHLRDIPSLGFPIAAFLVAEDETKLPGLNLITVGDDWFGGEPRAIDPKRVVSFASPDAVCRVELSSGTTGHPKAISLSVDQMYRWVLNYYHSIGQGSWDRMLCLPALPSSWGFTMAVHTLYAGKTLVFAASAHDTLHMIAIHNVDCLVASTQHLRELVDEQRRNPVPCRSLRVMLTGGSLHSPALLTEARASLCASLVVQYGSTEAGGTAFATADRLIGVEGAVGYVAPWAEVEALDEDGQVLPPDSDGILRIRATCQGQPYPEERAHTNESFRDGWFYPGDTGRVTAEGLLIVSGRLSEVINAGGTKLAPETVEDTVRLYPGIADVAALAGTGASGEEVWVAISARTPVDPQALIRFCAARNIPVDRVAVTDAIPRNRLGKIERGRLKPLFGG